jgi:hypothetical protein
LLPQFVIDSPENKRCLPGSKEINPYTFACIGRGIKYDGITAQYKSKINFSFLIFSVSLLLWLKRDATETPNYREDITSARFYFFTAGE